MNTEERLALARTIRPARKLRGWSQAQLADASGVGIRSIQSAEKAKPATVPSMATLSLMKHALESDTHVCATSKWSPDVEVLLDIIGMFLESLEGEERQAWIDRLTRTVVLRDHT